MTATTTSPSDTPSSNRAAWQESKGAQLAVKDAPLWECEPDEVLIKNRFVAINPADTFMQSTGILVETYPTVLGSDVAGTVERVGSAVSHVKPGDRVLGYTPVLTTKQAKHGAFQQYSVSPAHEVIALPDNVQEHEAVVLPMGFTTAASGLFPTSHLALAYPPMPGAVADADADTDSAGSSRSGEKGGTVLVWGGSSSTGACAVQLASLAGYSVVATCSPRNDELVRGLGATTTVDYASPNVVDDVVDALRKTNAPFAGAFVSVQDVETHKLVFSLLGQLASAPESENTKEHVIATVATRLPDNICPAGMRIAPIFGSGLFRTYKEIGEYIWSRWLPLAFARGAFQCKPEGTLVTAPSSSSQSSPGGLESIQKALDALRKGVSGRKIVVEL